jgi:tetratricopeptide (TPR) repeat protein
LARRKSKSRQDRTPSAPKSVAPEAPKQARPPLTPSRRYWFRLCALLLVPLILLGSLELGLRVAGYGFATTFFREVTIGGQRYFVDNDDFGFRFFPPALARMPSPVKMRADKDPGCYRIFIFGESAALGDPRPHFGASRYLEALLHERFPAAKFEIINTGVTAINSHAILPIARECARRQGDLWIVYMGNNEMVGPFGAATVFGQQTPPLALVRLSLAIQRTRTGQLLNALGRKLRNRSGSTEQWRGMEMFTSNKVAPSDSRKTVVYQSFGRNLDDLLRSGVKSGAIVLLNTVAVNLKDCPPFASVSGTNLADALRSEFEKLSSKAAAVDPKTDPAAAAQACNDALKFCPDSADLHFRLGNSYLAVTNTVDARREYELARDLDTLPFRADSRINGLIASAGHRFAGPKVVLCDVAAALATNTPAGPGHESFFEHVHLNFDGNYRLGRFWADEVKRFLPQGTLNKAKAEWASQDTCERRLGFTDWNRLSVIMDVIGRLTQPPLNGQSNSKSRMDALQLWTMELRQRMTNTPPEQARAVYLDALQAAPDDYRLHENFAEFLDLRGDTKEAAVERRKVRDLIPYYYFSHYSLGVVLKDLGQLDEARDCFLKAVELNPRQAENRTQLATVYARQNQWDKAAREYERARAMNPEDPRIYLYSAEVLWKLGRRSEALERLREAVRLNPDYWEAHYRLGEDLAIEGRITEALAEFEHVLRLNPGYVKAHVNLAVAFLKLGRGAEAIREAQEALRLDPNSKQALDLQRQMMGR